MLVTSRASIMDVGKKKKKVLPRWKKKHPAARVSRPWGVIVKQNKSFRDVFFYFFILRAGYQQQPRRLCVCLRVCARLGGGGFRWSKCWEVCAQQVGNVFCELEGSVIQFIYKPWKKKCSNIIPPYGHYCKGILNQRSGGGKKKKKERKYTEMQRNTRESEKKTHKPKANKPRGIYLNPVPFMVLLIWTNIVLCVWIKK